MLQKVLKAVSNLVTTLAFCLTVLIWFAAGMKSVPNLAAEQVLGAVVIQLFALLVMGIMVWVRYYMSVSPVWNKSATFTVIAFILSLLLLATGLLN
jgi:hypothetical protein